MNTQPHVSAILFVFVRTLSQVTLSKVLSMMLYAFSGKLMDALKRGRSK